MDKHIHFLAQFLQEEKRSCEPLKLEWQQHSEKQTYDVEKWVKNWRQWQLIWNSQAPENVSDYIRAEMEVEHGTEDDDDFISDGSN